MNRLRGITIYECGSMDYAPDGGITWRNEITPFLKSKGCIVIDPTNKPVEIGKESSENRVLRSLWKSEGEYDKVLASMREIRAIDLLLVDISLILLLYIDLDIFMMGSIEEVSWANRLKRPILVVCKQGKSKIPDWLFGMIPHQTMFNNFEELKSYLTHIDEDESINDLGRWRFLDFYKLIGGD